MKTQILTALITLAVLTACNLSQYVGTYTGSAQIYDTDSSHRGETSLQVSEKGSSSLLIQFSGDASLQNKQAVLSFHSSTSADLSGDLVSGQTIALQADGDSNCFNNNTTDTKVTICVADGSLSFSIKNADHSGYEIWASKDSGAGNSSATTPSTPSDSTRLQTKDYTVEELRNLSVAKSYDNRIEAEKVFQAQKTAKASYLALAPRLTLNSISTILSGGGVGLIGALGDLTPFLFPTNWIVAHENLILSRAEQQTERILKADAALQMEVLSNSVIRDQAIIQVYDQRIHQALEILNQVQVREHLGQYPQGSADNINSIVQGLQHDQTLLKEALIEEKQNLAVAAGSGDINAIQSISWNLENDPIDHPWQPNLNDIVSQGLSNSLEIAQSQTLLQYAQEQKKGAYWSWMDPSGNYLTGIGLPYGEIIQVGQSQVREMQIQIEQIHTQFVTDMNQAYQDYMQSLTDYKMSQDGVDIQTRRLNLLLDKMSLGGALDFFGLTSVLQDAMAADLRLANSLGDYRCHRARLQRVILADFYSQFKQ